MTDAIAAATSPSSTPAGSSTPAAAPAAAAATPATIPSDSGSTDLGTDAPDTSGQTDLGSDAPAPDAEAPAEKPLPEFFGELPEGSDYEPFTLPEGSVADPELQTDFSGLAKELKLNQAGAQKLVDYKTKLDQHQLKKWGEHTAELRSKAKADPEIGGAKYDAAVAAGRTAIAKFGGNAAQIAELKQVMNHYGVGAHPAMIRFMSNIARATGETPTIGGAGGSGGSVEKPLHELFYGDNRSEQGK